MTRAVIRLHVQSVGPGASSLIDRYLGTRQQAWRLHYAGVDPESPLGDVTVELIDTADHPVIDPNEATLWHVLWVRNEDGSTVSLQHGDTRAPWPIAPGDTIPVPADATLTTTGGQLGLAIRVRSATAAVAPPTHGTDRFFGYNRQTLASRLGGARLCRWKLTQPLVLADHYAGPVLVMALARATVIRTERTIDQLRQGEAALIDPRANPIVTPDGLAYLLTIDMPQAD